MAAGVSSCIQFVSFELQLVRRQKIYLGPREGRRDREDWRRRQSPPLSSFFSPRILLSSSLKWSHQTTWKEKRKNCIFRFSVFEKQLERDCINFFSTTYRQFFVPLKMVSACLPILCCCRRAAVVAQRKSTRNVTERLWVQIQPGAGLFLSYLSSQ